MRISLRRLLYVVTAVAVLTRVGWVYVNSPAIPVEKLEKIKGGMSLDELELLVGPPSSHGEWEHWSYGRDYYTHPWKYGSVEVEWLGEGDIVSVDVVSRFCPEELRHREWDWDDVSRKWVLRGN